MARISLIICDLCKNQMNTEESQEEYSVTLSSLNETETSGEICFKCYKSLLNRLKSPEKLEVKKAVAAKPPLVKPLADYQEAPEPGEATPIAAEDYERPAESTEELLDQEIKIVPSNFDRRKAVKAMREMNDGSCLHHFKTFRDGKVVCADAPGGVEGELAGFKGCGKVLNARQYTVSKPRHFAFKS